jgi:hypothetical protein
MWILLSILHTILVTLKILYIRYDKTPYIMFPFIINIIVAGISLSYFILYYKEHFTTEFVKPKYYLYAIVGLFVNVLGYYIIKTCPNPAYFRVFVSLQIILLFLFTIFIHKDYEISIQSAIGMVCGCLAITLISLDKNNR